MIATVKSNRLWGALALVAALALAGCSPEGDGFAVAGLRPQAEIPGVVRAPAAFPRDRVVRSSAPPRPVVIARPPSRVAPAKRIAAPRPPAPRSAAKAKPMRTAMNRTPPPAVRTPQKIASTPVAAPTRAAPTRAASSGVAPIGAAPAAAPSGAAPMFDWPVRGTILARFGRQGGGQDNSGVDIAVPDHTPIKSADDGVVIYAGTMKSFGNLALVRHAGDYVTAYAHAKEFAVKRGDQVKRGDVIGHSGQSGNAATPRLHFEVRKGSTPVDPLPLLRGNSDAMLRGDERTGGRAADAR